MRIRNRIIPVLYRYRLLVPLCGYTSQHWRIFFGVVHWRELATRYGFLFFMFILRNIVTAVTDLDLIFWSDPSPKVLKVKLNCTILKLLYIISGPVLDPQYRRNYCKFFVQYRHIPGDFLCIFKGLYLFAEVFSLMVSISRRFFVRKRLEVLIRIQLKISILVQTIYFLFL